MSPFNATIIWNSSRSSLVYSEKPDDPEFIAGLTNKTYIFWQFTWNVEAALDSFPWNLDVEFGGYNPHFDARKNIIFCSPTAKVHEVITSRGWRSVQANHNCLLDENKFAIGSEQRIYNAVINSRPFWWKRVYLARDVKNLAYIKGVDWARDDTSWDGYQDMNLGLLAEDVVIEEVVKIYQMSEVGLILSGNTGEHQQGKFEGANYCSTEFLLCGLPVITTPNEGGRNLWLNKDNSLVSEPDPKNVSQCVSTAIEMLRNGDFSRDYIRRSTIQLINQQRNNICAEITKILGENGEYFDGKKIFNSVFKHKLTTYHVTPREILEQINAPSIPSS